MLLTSKYLVQLVLKAYSEKFCGGAKHEKLLKIIESFLKLTKINFISYKFEIEQGLAYVKLMTCSH